MTKVLITGATGFTGRYLAPLLEQAGWEVHGTVHGDAGARVAGVSALHPLDITDPGAVARLVSDVGPDKVVHLAAIAFVAHSDVAEMYRANVLGTRNLLDSLANSNCAPGSVVVASSANVYGNAREGVLDESIPPAPANDYGVTKASAELLAGTYSNRLPIIVTRPFNYTGRGQSPKFLIPKIVRHVRDGEPRIELGNIDVARDFSDVRTVADAYARLLRSPAAIGGTFNICSGEAVPIRKVIELVTAISAHNLEVRGNPALVRADEVKSLCGSPTKLESVVGPLERHPLEETLRWMLEA